MDFKLTTEATIENPVVGDLHLTNGQITLNEETLEATAQRLRVRLNFFRGEWYLDMRQGIPGWESILGAQNPNPTRIAKMFRQAILETPGIASVSEVRVTFTSETRELELSFKATTDEGQLLDLTRPFIVELP